MFLYNKYTKWYFSIIESAKKQNRKRSEELYYENHHIIPQSLGGKRNKENEVLLTAKEHYICHYLLIKMVENNEDRTKMSFGFHGMRRNPNGNGKRYNSRLYENVKKRISYLISGENNPFYGKGHFGEDNHFYGKTHKPETKKKISENLTGLMLGEKNPFYGKNHSDETKQKLREQRSKPIEVLFTDGRIQCFPTKRSLGPYLGKSEALGAKLNNPTYKCLWEKYNIENIKEL